MSPRLAYLFPKWGLVAVLGMAGISFRASIKAACSVGLAVVVLGTVSLPGRAGGHVVHFLIGRGVPVGTLPVEVGVIGPGTVEDAVEGRADDLPRQAVEGEAAPEAPEQGGQEAVRHGVREGVGH